jgi:16S rRNA A1518/A1519 N6-dimethyltransferase RsmA/KsgA/DIM1 with predicted DNA glycosylase/AP lyase activity
MGAVPKEVIARALQRCLIDPKRRAETLTIDEYMRLSSVLKPDKAVA